MLATIDFEQLKETHSTLSLENTEGEENNTKAIVDIQSMLTIVKSMNRIPFEGFNIAYNDFIWDFSQKKNINISNSKLKISFINMPSKYVEILKDFVVLQIARETKKIQSIYEEAKIIKNFLNFIEEHNIFALQHIDISVLEQYFGSKEVTLTYEIRLKSVIKKFLIHFTEIGRFSLSKEILDFLDIDKTKRKRNKILTKTNKIPNLPDGYFNQLLSIALAVTKSNNPDDLKYKSVALAVILLSQTGLRISELCALKIDCIKKIKIDEENTIGYLEYSTWKRERSNNVVSKEYGHLNELVEYAVEELINLHADERRRLNINYLILDPWKEHSSDFYPIPGDRYTQVYMNKFYYYIDKYMPTINLSKTEYPFLSETKAINTFGNTKKYLDKTIFHPVSESFRIHFASKLYEKKVPIEYVEKYLGHQSKKMYGYDIRVNLNGQENEAFSKDIFMKIISNKIEPLGGKSDLVLRITDFIQENNYNISTDLELICDNLSKKVPVRQKSGGVCIKSSTMRECSVDAQTNEFYCAYDVCPNIYHFYYMASFTYEQVCQVKNSMEINLQNGFLRQYEKDKNMLHALIKNKLLPELDSLKKYLTIEGSSSILSDYPDLKSIIENLESIYTEAKECLEKN